MDEKRPIITDEGGHECMNGEMIVNWPNKLDIGDANMYVLYNKENGFKELIVSYK
jgi:hypothetical protein